MFLPREELAGHIRVLTGLTAGNESQLARFTGALAYLLFWTILIGSVLLWLDRRRRLHAKAGSEPQADEPSVEECKEGESATEQ